MTTLKSEWLYQQWSSAAQKFDYFVTGVSLAVIGYLSASLNLGPLALDSRTLQLVSTLLILGSAACGLKRIESFTGILGIMSRRLNSEEMAAKLESSSWDGTPLHDGTTGGVLSPAAAAAQAAGYRRNATAYEAQENKIGAAAGRWYKWRNQLLFSGFLGLLASKVLIGYGL